MTEQRRHLLFFPYLQLSEPVLIDAWWLGALKDFEGAWESDRFREQCRAFLSSFRTHDDKPVGHMALLADASRGVTGELPDKAERNALERAVLLGSLATNPKGTEENAGHFTRTSDNADLHIWPIDLDEGWVALSRGSLLQVTTGGLSIGDEKLVITPPMETHIPWPSAIDGEMADAVYKVLTGQTSASDEENGRLRRSIEWLGRAWSNTPSISDDTRIVMLKTAFEALTGEFANAAAARWLRGNFEQLSGQPVERHGDLLWNPDESETMEWPAPDGGTEPCTPLEHWYRSFGKARNAIIHGGPEPEIAYPVEDSAYAGSFFWAGERLFREAIAVHLWRYGFDSLWVVPVQRSIRAKLSQYFEEAQAELES